MVLIVSERKCYNYTGDPCIEKVVAVIREKVWEVDDLVRSEGLCGVVGEIILQAAKMVCGEDVDISDLTVEVDNPVKGLAMRGLLRLLGIAAKIRLRPGGGTTHDDLERARKELRILAALADL